MKSKRSDIQIINAFAISLLQQNTLEDLMWSIAENIGKLLSFEDCVIYLKDQNMLVQMAAHGVKNPTSRDIKNQLRIPIGNAIVGTVGSSGIAEIVYDTRKDKRYLRDEFSGKSELAVPILYENEVIGIFDSESSIVGGFDEQDLQMLQSLANIAAPRIASALAQQEKEKAEESLRHAKQEAEEANQAKSEFLSRMSHELRTPLTAILGFSRLMKMDAGDQVDKRLEHILVAGEHLLMLIDEILDIVRIEQRQFTLKSREINIKPIVEECIGMNRVEADQLGISIKDEYPTKEKAGGRVKVFADPQRLKQVLLNIISNAVKYNCENGQVGINVGQCKDGFVRFEVVDTGIGISKEDLHKVFEPFVRFGDLQHKVEGTGMGMVITRQLIELMRGQIFISSELGKGSTVSFTLPGAADADLLSK